MPRLQAAANKVDLKPPLRGWMTGFAARLEPSSGLHDPIMARAVLLQSADVENRFPKQPSSLAIVACDLLGFSPESVARMRRRIKKRTGIDEESVLVACTHTHSGPASLPMRGVIGHVDHDWLCTAEDKIVDLVCDLTGRLLPARFGYASVQVSGVGFNRQDKSRPHDEELIVLAVESTFGEPIATIVNYATHAVVLGSGWTSYSADFPGVVNSRIEESRGGVCLYLQGACGDVNPCVDLRGNFEDCERIGETLSTAALNVLTDAPRANEATLAVASKTVEVPLDPPPTLERLDQQIAGFKADLAAAAKESDQLAQSVAEAMLQWAQELRELIVRNAVPKTLLAELFAAAVNEVRIIGLPFETYSDIGLGIKTGLAPLRTMFVGYANGLLGYVPTDWAKDQGGYGPEGSYYWFSSLVTPVGYGAADLLVCEGVALGKSLPVLSKS